MKAAVTALILTMLAPAAAAAQTFVPKKIVLDDFGACIVRQAPKLSVKLMATPLGSVEERNLAETLAKANNQCIRGRAYLSGRVGALRGSVAEALFARDQHLLLALSNKGKALAKRAPEAQGRAFAIGYATCLEAADPRATAGFLLTVPTTDDERKAFLAYGDSLKDCMPTGQAYKVDITDIRNQVAAIAYRDVMPQTKG